FCYSNTLDEDAATERLSATADHWRKITAMNDADAAALVRGDGIDILVDLAVHSSRNRLGIFARRAAPVQVTHVGYPGTTGLSETDSRIPDALLDPPNRDTGVPPVLTAPSIEPFAGASVEHGGDARVTSDPFSPEGLVRLPGGFYLRADAAD